MTEITVPLFPLGVVLFPGMVLPLHIFEPRYREMVRTCLDENRLFGLLLAQEGEDPCAEGSVGTLAAIQDVQTLPDGRMNIVTVGVTRFRLLELVAGEAFLQGRVQPLDELASQDGDQGVQEAFVRYLRSLAEMTDTAFVEPELSQDPGHLSFHVAATLPLDLPIKQDLLERETPDRLEFEIRLLESEISEVLDYGRTARKRGYFFFKGRRLSLN
jgi:Lon protease-like protein